MLVGSFCAGARCKATFVADDYRYLSELDSFRPSWNIFFTKAAVVENRWDDNWWVPKGAAVRFYRPFILPSFALDHFFWGKNAAGFYLTNVLLHCLATFLVWLCFCSISGPGMGAWVASLAFGLHACHGENLWYVSGRTDTLALIFFLAAILVFLGERKLPRGEKFPIFTWLTFLLALLAKEYNALLVVFLPLLDLSLGKKSIGRNLPLAAGCLVVGAVYWALRSLAFKPFLGLVSYPFPYFHLPSSPVFWPSLATALLQYGQGITTGFFIEPFLAQPAVFLTKLGAVELALGAFSLMLVIFCGLKFPRARIYLCFFLVPLLAILPLYSSARYLYAPSFGYCGILGVMLEKLFKNRHILISLLLLGILVALPAARLRRQLDTCAGGDVARPEAHITKLIDSLALDDEKIKAAYFLDFPFSWLQNQFLQSTVEQMLGKKLPRLVVLTRASPRSEPGPTQVKFIDEQTLELSRGEKLLYEPDPYKDFAPRLVQTSEQIEERDYTVSVKDSVDSQATRIIVQIKAGAKEYKLFRFKDPATLEAIDAPLSHY